MNEDQHGPSQAAPEERQSGEPIDLSALGRNRTRWSSEVIAVVGTGVALLAVLIGGFISVNNRLDSVNNRVDELTGHRENRLASVQTHIESRVEAFRQTVDGNLNGQDTRLTAFEVRLTKLEVQAEDEK
ncbi:MAG: hypothetical protein OXH96_06330 [Spirochaetaceae bacterium]|nr:hypothetical protein [Spirochaetaceae bacterium]